MSVLSIVLLALAALVVLGAEWPRIAQATGAGERLPRSPRSPRAPRPSRGPRPASRSHLRVVESEDADDFVASVRRDLDRLPTVDPDKDR